MPTLDIREHRFEPNRVEVPAHVKFRLRDETPDDTADEFESVDLNREKLVAPGQTITVFLGPLEPGEYKFFGDFRSGHRTRCNSSEMIRALRKQVTFACV